MTATERCYKSLYTGLLSVYTHTNEKLLAHVDELNEIGRQKDKKIDRLDEIVAGLNQKIKTLQAQQKRQRNSEPTPPAKKSRLEEALVARSESSEAVQGLLTLDSGSDSDTELTPAEETEYERLNRVVLGKDGSWKIDKKTKGYFATYILSLLRGYSEEFFDKHSDTSVDEYKQFIDELESECVSTFENKHGPLERLRDEEPGIWQAMFPAGPFVPLKWLPEFLACVPCQTLKNIHTNVRSSMTTDGLRLVQLARKKTQ